MAHLPIEGGFPELQQIAAEVYGLPNSRWFELADMVTNVTRFTMRSIKAVRKLGPVSHTQAAVPDEASDRVVDNLGIAWSWLASSANRLNLDIDAVLWDRFPGCCHYCRQRPCRCPRRGRASPFERPASIAEYQAMFAEIYPVQSRSVTAAALHLIEETGELQEAILLYRTRHREQDFLRVGFETADYVSCALGLFTSAQRSMAEQMSRMFNDNCHICHKAPCQCPFDFVMDYDLGDKW